MSNELYKLVTHFFYYTLIIALCAINSTFHIPHSTFFYYLCNHEYDERYKSDCV